MLTASIDQRRALVRRGRKPLVGYVSQRNTLAVSEVNGRVRVEVGFRTRVLVALMAAVFGPGLALLFALAPERFTRMPSFIQVVVVAAVAGMSFLLVRTLLRRPRFEVHANGDIVVRDPSMTIARADLRSAAIETDMYSNPPRIYVPNAVLVVRTAEDEIRLCASPDSRLIEMVANRVATRARIDLTHQNEISRQVKP